MTSEKVLEARITAAKRRLGDLKAKHSVYTDKPKYAVTLLDQECLISDMEAIAYSAICYLDGVPGPYLTEAEEDQRVPRYTKGD